MTFAVPVSFFARSYSACAALVFLAAASYAFIASCSLVVPAESPVTEVDDALMCAIAVSKAFFFVFNSV